MMNIRSILLFCILSVSCCLSSLQAGVAGDKTAGFIHPMVPGEQPDKSSQGDPVFSIGGDLRLRFESLENFNIKQTLHDQDTYFLERFRLNFTLQSKHGIQALVQFQDAHSIDAKLENKDFKGSSPFNNDLDLRQASIQWKKIKRSPFGFKVGRQAISYRDNRVFGPGEWGNVGRYTWDAAVFKYEDSHVSLDAFYAKRLFYRPSKFLDDHYPYDVYAVYAQLKKWPFNADLFYVCKDNENDEDKFNERYMKEQRHTIGIYLQRTIVLCEKKCSLNCSGLYACQTGRYPNKDKNISASGAFASLGLDLNLFVPQSFSVRYSYGSGDRDANDDNVQTFDGIFGAIDLYYGRMNLFSWMNIKDCQLTYELKSGRGFKLITEYHWFYVDEKSDAWYYGTGKPARTGPQVSAAGSDFLGRELDVFVVYKATKSLEFQTGYCRFSPGDVIVKSGFHAVNNYFIFQTSLEF